MVSVPRIVVTEFASAQRIHSWREHCDDAFAQPGAKRPPVDPADRFVWQLSSANNRAVARGYRAHASVEGVMEDVAAARARRDELAVRSIRMSHLPVYAWIATLDGEPMVMAARSYSTVRDMRDSIAMAWECLAIASVTTARREAPSTRPVATIGKKP